VCGAVAISAGAKKTEKRQKIERNRDTYTAYEDQKVEMEAKSREGQVFIQKGAAHRLGIR
jgi:hypothetical protein